MAEDRLRKGELLEGWMSRMNGMWVSFSCSYKHLPANTWHFINPSPLSSSYTTFIPAASRLPSSSSSKWSHSFNVSLFRATARILQMSGEIFLTQCDGAAIKGNGMSATKAQTLIKRKKKKWVAKWKCVSDGEKEVRRWWLLDERRKMCLLCISSMCDVCVVHSSSRHSSSQTLLDNSKIYFLYVLFTWFSLEWSKGLECLHK